MITHYIFKVALRYDKKYHIFYQKVKSELLPSKMVYFQYDSHFLESQKDLFHSQNKLDHMIQADSGTKNEKRIPNLFELFFFQSNSSPKLS